MKSYIPKGTGACAKVVVKAQLTTTGGEQFESTNFCLTPQTTCPRDVQGYGAGEGYHLCKQVCNQPGHAEENVIFFAKKNKAPIRGSNIVVDYSRICNNCQRICQEEGVGVCTNLK